MSELTAECKTFIQEGTRTGKVATVRADGRPHVVPVWFVVDGDTIIFSTSKQSVKAKNMHRDPRVCFCVEDETSPYGFAQLDGTVTFNDDLSEMKQWNIEIARRYVGNAQAQSIGERNTDVSETIVHFTPTKVLFTPNVTS